MQTKLVVKRKWSETEDLIEYWQGNALLVVIFGKITSDLKEDGGTRVVGVNNSTYLHYVNVIEYVETQATEEVNHD